MDVGRRDWCREDLDRGTAEAIATVAGYLFANAKAGNVAAQIFILKTRAGWRERTATDEAAPAADGEPHSEILLLPDNCRDHELTAALRDAQRQFFAEKRRQPAAMIPPISAPGDQGRLVPRENIAAIWPDDGHDLLDGSTKGA
jgi:hypothetical protein